jgi:hypothetical protein
MQLILDKKDGAEKGAIDKIIRAVQETPSINLPCGEC